MNILIIVVVLLKFIFPVTILWFPFVGIWGNYFLDVVDGDVLQYLGLDEYSYQMTDKIADLWSYVFMAIWGWRLRVKKTVVVLFVYRLVGQLLFFATYNEMMFLYFQNFLEPFLMIYALLIFKTKSEEKAYVFYKKHIVMIWGIILGYKLWNEWYLHFANIDLSTMIFGVDGRSLK